MRTPPQQNCSLFVLDDVMFLFLSICLFIPFKNICRVSSQNKAWLKGHQQPSSPNKETRDYTIQLYILIWGMTTNHSKDPYLPSSTMESMAVFLLLTCLKAQAFSHFFLWKTMALRSKVLTHDDVTNGTKGGFLELWWTKIYGEGEKTSGHYIRWCAWYLVNGLWPLCKLDGKSGKSLK